MPINNERERRAATSVAKFFRPRPVKPDGGFDLFDRAMIAWTWNNFVTIPAKPFQARGFPINVITSEVEILNDVDAIHPPQILNVIDGTPKVLNPVTGRGRNLNVMNARPRRC